LTEARFVFLNENEHEMPRWPRMMATLQQRSGGRLPTNSLAAFPDEAETDVLCPNARQRDQHAWTI
jgi:hypothetical protein